MPKDGGETLIQSLREQRLVTLALADKISEDRWREPLLPGDRSAHALLSHLLAWDEWAMAAFELDPLPEKLIRAYREVDAFNARAVARFNGIQRDDLLTGLEGARARVLSAAKGAGGETWPERRIPELAPPDTGAPSRPSRGPSVAGMLRMLLEHERQHDDELSSTFNISVDLEELRRQAWASDANGAVDTETDTDADGDNDTERE